MIEIGWDCFYDDKKDDITLKLTLGLATSNVKFNHQVTPILMNLQGRRQVLNVNIKGISGISYATI